MVVGAKRAGLKKVLTFRKFKSQEEKKKKRRKNQVSSSSLSIKKKKVGLD